MIGMEKKELYKCPYCGSDKVDVMDTDEDFADKDTIVMCRSLECRKCEKTFAQAEEAKVIGYTIYDEYGEIIYDTDMDRQSHPA